VKQLYLVTITSAVLYVLYSSLAAYLDLPVVGINQEGECAYIETQGVRDYSCDTMPSKYVKEIVR